MIMRIFTPAMLVMLCLLGNMSTAAEAVDSAVADKIRKSLETGENSLKVESIKASEADGVYEVQLQQGPVVYALAGGEFFILGDLYTVGVEGYVNLSEQRRDTERVEQLAQLDTKDMIVFPAKGETRSYVTVFTDTTCFYCQKLHKEVPELQRRGVEVRYLAYPRGGAGTDGFQQLVTAWCSDDPGETLTRMKNKEKVAIATCEENPVAAQYKLGVEMGVRGTPAIITADGQMLPGYQSASDLIETIGLN
jgi:thiol:disulfide interchange protein DsbC